jgi:hypothetical protein
MMMMMISEHVMSDLVHIKEESKKDYNLWDEMFTKDNQRKQKSQNKK